MFVGELTPYYILERK